jgi:hypothetical protein
MKSATEILKNVISETVHLCEILFHNRENSYGNETAIFTTKVIHIPNTEKA